MIFCRSRTLLRPLTIRFYIFAFRFRWKTATSGQESSISVLRLSLLNSRITMQSNRLGGSLTGQSNEIFDLHFLHYSIMPGPLTNGLNHVWFRRVIGILIWTNLQYLQGHMTPAGEIDSPGYDNRWSHVLVDFLLTRWAMILWGAWLSGVWYPRRLTRWGVILWGDRKIWITWRILNQNPRYFIPLVSGPGWF